MTEKTFTLKKENFYDNGQVKPSAIMKQMEKLANDDCVAEGCGYDFLRAHSTVFVLTKLAIKFFSRLKVGDVVTIMTFSYKIDKIVFDREYSFTTVDNGIVAYASTYWILMNYDTRKIVRPKDFPFPFSSNPDAYAAPIDIPRGFSGGAMKFSTDKVVKKDDLDDNDHLNNCVYADVALDAVEGFEKIEKRIKMISIIFHHEARLDDYLEVYSSFKGDVAVVEAKNKTKAAKCFEAEITFTN